MRFPPALIEELELLARFDPATTQHGLKIHKDAAPALIAACERLFHKGLVTRHDGGYLTPLGHDAAEQVELLLCILTSRPNGAARHSEVLAAS